MSHRPGHIDSEMSAAQFDLLYGDEEEEAAAPQQTEFRDLQAYEGRQMLDPITGAFGILKKGYKESYGGTYYYLYDPNTKNVVTIVRPGGNLLDPANRAFLAVGDTYKDTRVSTASAADLARYGLGATDSGGGGGGGGGGGAAIVGARAPDPSGAAQLLLEYYDRQVQSGMMPWETAMKEFESNLARAQAMNTDIREREIAETSRQLRVAEEAGSRARTVASEILPRSLPNTQNINLPLMGNVPLNQVNVDQLFNQGLPPLAQMQGISQTPATPYPELNLPPVQMPQLPNIQNYVNQTAGGFTGWVM